MICVQGTHLVSKFINVPQFPDSSLTPEKDAAQRAIAQNQMLVMGMLYDGIYFQIIHVEIKIEKHV